MTTRVQQTPVVMLTVQFDQRFGQCAQNLTTGSSVVDPSRLAPVTRVNPA